eukprot:992131_1
MMLKLGTFAAMVVALSPGFQCSGLSRQVNPEYNFVMDFKNHVHGTQRCREPGNTEVLEDVFGIDKYSWDDFADPGSKIDDTVSVGKDLSVMKALYYEKPWPIGGFLMSPSELTEVRDVVFECLHGDWRFTFKYKGSPIDCRAETVAEKFNWNRLAYGCIWITGVISVAAGYQLTSAA